MCIRDSPSTPYTKNEKGHGPAWANSLFEDFCEFGPVSYTHLDVYKRQAVSCAMRRAEAGAMEFASLLASARSESGLKRYSSIDYSS